ncbi:MAG: hypothetical protein H5U40_11200, partial [Polyangiaceae bacterium]|nr:hypothetical protein [Polyangiaceae bacterium]
MKNRFRVGLVLLLGLTFLGAALYEGVTFGVPRLHLFEEALVFAVGLGWVTYLLMRAESVRRASVALVEQLRSAQAALEGARLEMSSLSQGIADKVELQLTEWGLTRSE